MQLLQQINQHFAQSIETKQQAQEKLAPALVQAAERLAACLREGGKVLICGNGGSAADAQHFSAELVGRFEQERRALPALALTTDTSTLTAVANDYHFERVFARQVEALGRAGDVLVAISTSGNSPNVIAAVRAAQAQEMVCIVLSGRNGGALAGLLQANDIELCVPATSTARIQEVHILAIHCLCDLVDRILFAGEADT